jgi:hypothetical protein
MDCSGWQFSKFTLSNQLLTVELTCIFKVTAMYNGGPAGVIYEL